MTQYKQVKDILQNDFVDGGRVLANFDGVIFYKTPNGNTERANFSKFKNVKIRVY